MTLSPFWPAGLSRRLVAPRTSLYYNLEVSATRYPDKTAVEYYGTSISYAQLQREVDALAGFLQSRCNVTRGDRVVLYMQNSPQFIVAFYAILRADAVVVPVNPMSLAAELRHIVEDCGARVLILADELYEHASPLFGDALQHAVIARYGDYLHDTRGLPCLPCCRKRRTVHSLRHRTHSISTVAKPFAGGTRSRQARRHRRTFPHPRISPSFPTRLVPQRRRRDACTPIAARCT